MSLRYIFFVQMAVPNTPVRADGDIYGLGCMTSALYSSSANGATSRFNKVVEYNANGSITSLLRGGMKNDGTFGLIDDLAITYDGNRLVKVTDDAEALNYNGALDFNDGDDATCEYDYDSNGALTRDGNRGINSITYDYGHHPYYINMNMTGGPRNITNAYTSDGRKLSSRHVTSIPHANGYTRKTTTDMYIDGLMLRGGAPLLWQFSGGYAELDANGTPTCWNYYVTDHLGSTRMVVSSNDSIKETINYYPFGSEMRMEDPALLTGGTSHPFRFTGKELDRLNSLNMYDFGARWYDVAGVPMWTSIDPLCEKYYNVSPYVYCANNSVNSIDVNGCDTINISDKDGSWNVEDPILAEGNDVFNVTINGETNCYNFSEGKYGNRMNILVLEDDEKTESFGVYHLSGTNIVGYAIQPEGPENSLCSGKRIPEGSYSTFIGYGENWYSYIGLHGSLRTEGIRVHYGSSRKWSQGCIIISSDYYSEDGHKLFNLNQSREAVWNYVKYLGASSRKENIPMPANQKRRFRDIYTYPSNNRVRESSINIMNR